MTPCDFEQVNKQYHAPPGHEQHVASIPSFTKIIERGPFEGAPAITVAWLPSPDEIRQLVEGNAVYITFIGAIPPHTVSSNFADSQKAS